jgi:hypothetical protein
MVVAERQPRDLSAVAAVHPARMQLAVPPEPVVSLGGGDDETVTARDRARLMPIAQAAPESPSLAAVHAAPVEVAKLRVRKRRLRTLGPLARHLAFLGGDDFAEALVLETPVEGAVMGIILPCGAAASIVALVYLKKVTSTPPC